MRILIAYATTEGHTRKIARFLADELRSAGHQVTLADVTDEPPPPAGHDAAILGGSIHAGGLQEGLAHYARSRAAALNALPSAFFSVSLSMAGDEEVSREEVRQSVAKLLAKTGFSPRQVVHWAGALRYTEYNWFKRYLMRTITGRKGSTDIDTSRDYAYTDWDEVKAFCRKFPG
jgi:menaquinone-dependent protoporphyrinogen oxidase